MTDPNSDLLFDPALYHNLPPEDRPSRFIADYKNIEVKTDDLESFAKSLQAELEQNYLPHRDKMAAELAVGDVYSNEFAEFVQALTRHAEIRQITLQRLFDHGDGTGRLSVAADQISKNYSGADAYSAATSRDVDTVIQAPSATTTTNETPLNTSTVTSPNGAVTIPATTTTVQVPQDTTTTSSANTDDGTPISG